LSQAKPRDREKKRISPPRPRPLELRYILFLLLLVPAVIPLLISANYLVGKTKPLLKDQQQELLTRFAQGFAELLSDELARRRVEMRQLGRGLVAAPGFRTLEKRLQAGWVTDYLAQFAAEHRGELLAFRAVDSQGQGPATGVDNETVDEALNEVFAAARESGETVYRFTTLPQTVQPGVAIAVPVETPGGDDLLIVEALFQLPLETESLDIDEMFLIDAEGKLLWTTGAKPEIQQALLASSVVSDFAATPISVSSESELEVGGKTVSILARVAPVREPGWGVVAHKKTEEAFDVVEAMVQGIVFSSLLAVALAFAFALLATGWFSRPIRRLAEASHEIAAGNFARRVPATGMTLEVVKLAEDFNRMSDTVESYVERLRRAAEANRQLFISTIRAFAAAIDAKDPYTRGHSERVARYSRAISRYLGLPKEAQEKVWIAAVLHDIGKIGVDDQVLCKVGELTSEEFDKMKQHPAIGADILEPISALRDMLPGVRWHHESWNGSGYPDGLRGEQIPLMARVIGVADTFDAITTSRPYQEASSPEKALEIIKKLTGRRFDAKIVTAFLLAWEAGHIRMDSQERIEQSSTRLRMPPASRVAAGR
jgi:HD-GYP domain-containing protein (c-di-GMP phosphodiesterase class II)